MRSRVVKPLTAGFNSWTSRPVARSRLMSTIDGQLHEISEAPVPTVYESPRARYRSASFTLRTLTLDVCERAPDVDLGPHAAHHLVHESGGRSLAAQVRGAHSVRDRLQRGFINGAGGA